MRPSDIINKSDNKSIKRARTQHLVAKLYKVEDNKILYTVTSSSRTKQYIVTIQLLSLTGNKLKSLKSALQGDIRISCTCDAFLYRGYKYIAYKKQVGIDKETRAPNKTNPSQIGLACKHIIAALDQLKLDYTDIYNLFKSQPSTDKSSQHDKSDRNSVSEQDVELISTFKTACDTLYKEYVDYMSSENSTADQFINDKLYTTDPSNLLKGLSAQAAKIIRGTFISKLSSLNNILNFINQKKNGFNILVNSDTSTAIKRLNTLIGTKTESLINDIILTIIGERL